MDRPTIVSSVLIAAAAAVMPATPVAAGPIVGEWDPGFTPAEVGGQLVVDGYGVNGLGVYQVQLADGTVRAVCVQADVGHSLRADYQLEAGSSFGGELAYLTWAYLSGPPPTDVEAAAVNLLAWRYAGAQRRSGGPVWHGEQVEVRALGVGRLHEVEQATVTLHAEATGRRGPWALTDPVLADGSATIGVTGPGGPISGIAVTFSAATGWSAVAVTGPDGRASTAVPADATVVDTRAEGPGEAIVLAAPGSQRLAAPGPPIPLAATLTGTTTTSTTSTTSTTAPPTSTSTTTTPTTTTTTVRPPPTTSGTTPITTSTTTMVTSTTTTTTSAPTSTTTTTSAPTTATTTTSAPTTATTTTSAPTTATTTTTTTEALVPPTATSTSPPGAPPVTIPVTGFGTRTVTRIGSLLFAAGAAGILVAAPRRARRRPS